MRHKFIKYIYDITKIFDKNIRDITAPLIMHFSLK